MSKGYENLKAALQAGSCQIEAAGHGEVSEEDWNRAIEGCVMETKKRLIDANALKRHMIKAMEFANVKTINKDDIAYAIDNANAVDAVEVVRCKDCKHWKPIDEHIPHMECDVFCGAYEHGYPTNADDFCSYGERKTKDAE